MPFVGGITEGTEIGIVRRHNHDAASRYEQAMELFDGGDDIRDVLDDVSSTNLPERVIAKRVRRMIEVCEDVGPGVRIAIQPDRTGIFVDSAADIQDRKVL